LPTQKKKVGIKLATKRDIGGRKKVVGLGSLVGRKKDVQRRIARRRRIRSRAASTV